MNKLQYFLLFSIVSIFCGNSNLSYAQETQQNDIIQGPFKTSLYPEGKIYFVKENDATPDDRCQMIAFMLEYKQDHIVKKEKIDEYEENGGCVEVASVFFDKIHNKPYIFVMQKWEHSFPPAIQMGSDSYEIRAYTKNKEGKLVIDADVSADPNFEGIDGIVDDDVNPERHYKYKTAADVKRYLKKKYH
ncbi:unnamed protein product [Commensalibacter communis]|uniref:Uncharacterized protein n=1 Tax=Commensalibacter communis TaxID=2972786 RepID=A0A9W4TMF3_9PROT|nr:hypothetical protein [Commensalibacter communis]CAI3927563.1 unnamed protein product [Commensalibacter communis]CAI3929064.1 unnamed protein product [Commensalibacter communis]CAI3933436.1 unnamed protein product [Commensalibacter communis]CAI3933972.1 unnamed protein product [Commensalibacter communis]